MGCEFPKSARPKEEVGDRRGKGQGREQRGGHEVGKEKLERMLSCTHRSRNRSRYVEERG